MKAFLLNLSVIHTHYSSWVVFFMTGLMGYWLQLPLADQAAILSVVPVLKVFAPITGLVAFMIARGLPQEGPAAPTAAKPAA